MNRIEEAEETSWWLEICVCDVIQNTKVVEWKLLSSSKRVDLTTHASNSFIKSNHRHLFHFFVHEEKRTN